ncbi:MAG: GTPase ObgE, partial [Rhodobiaceae bacterium]|nr:GTPase ObgE [Rhodobiaceae bacterium]
GHIERCRVILHLVDGTQDDVADAYRTVRHELDAYGHGLEDKPEIVALNKIDALDDDTLKARQKALSKAAGQPAMALSGVSGKGVREVTAALARIIRAEIDDAEDVAPKEAWQP